MVINILFLDSPCTFTSQGAYLLVCYFKLAPNPHSFFSFLLFTFNVYMQPYGYDRHAQLLKLSKLNAQSNDPFFLYFCVVSPPALRRRDSAFGPPALLILSFIIKVIYRQVAPPLLDLLFDPSLPAYPLLLLDPLSPWSLDIQAAVLPLARSLVDWRGSVNCTALMPRASRNLSDLRLELKKQEVIRELLKG